MLVVAACSGDDDPNPGATAGDGGPRGRLAAPLRPDASCPVVIDTPPLLTGDHVPPGTALAPTTNPPSSGPHYPIWAAYQEFQTPVPRGYWLHSAEHGAIVLLYKCQDAGCPAIVEGLKQVQAALATDERCVAPTRVRVVITPDPDLDVPVAAVAWGWTYKADCLDLPTLTAFARDHYAQAPENTCAPGETKF